jgi:D-alanyl-D-alanine carboxypeptidase
MTLVLPKMAVTLPACLDGQLNGKLPASLLVDTPGLAGGPTVRLVEPAARSWRALAAAAGRDGIVLRATSIVDSYRPYVVQFNVFEDRYWPDPEPGFIGERYWAGHYDLAGNWVLGHTWYQKPHTAVAAVPGTSNHGRGLAVDVAGAGEPGPILTWLLAHAEIYGWSWEVDSEAWHIRYCTGDAIPAPVLAHERGDDDMGAFILSGFTGQPDATQGAYHVADASPQGYHLAPREPGWNAQCWPGAPKMSPGNPVPLKYTYEQVLAVLFGPRRQGGGQPPSGPMDLSEAAKADIRTIVDQELDEQSRAGADADA